MPKQSKPKGKTPQKGKGEVRKKTNHNSVPVQLPKKGPKKSEAQSAYERNRADAFDDPDQFQEGADKVSFGRPLDSDEGSGSENYDQEVSESEEEEEEDEDQDDAGEEEEDDDDEGGFAEKRAKLLKEEANTTKAWGKKKKGFYGADTGEYELMGDDERATIEEEEAESRRLQAEAAADLEEQDVDVSSLEALLAAKPKGNKATTKAEAGFRDDELLSALKKDLSELQAEKLSKDVSKMTKSEKQEVLKAESPELLTLLQEAAPLLSELRNNLHPLILKVRELPKETEGISFLELKHRLLLTYCTNLSFYLLLKAEGKQVKKHPVIKTLASLRTVSEKIRSIDTKLKYQIDKLLKMATLGPDHEKSKKDPLSFKPNAGDMLPKSFEQQGDGNNTNNEGIYQAPKITPVQFDADEKQLAKEKAKKAKTRAKMEQSGILNEFRDELMDRPREIKSLGQLKPQAQFLKEREEYEEDQFIRLAETKADKKKRLASQRIQSHEEDFDNLADFGDLHALTEATSEKQYGSKYDKIADKKIKKQPMTGDAPWEMSEESMAAGKAFYESNKAKGKQKKEAHKAAHPNRVYAYGKVDPNINEEGARRQAGGQIVKNRGLTRSRPKIAANPRAAKRAKFDKALVKRASTVQEYKGKTPHYAGESSGIKTNIIKSTKL